MVLPLGTLLRADASDTRVQTFTDGAVGLRTAEMRRIPSSDLRLDKASAANIRLKKDTSEAPSRRRDRLSLVVHRSWRGAAQQVRQLAAHWDATDYGVPIDVVDGARESDGQ